MREQHLDRELDAALARYAAVEPREGLEQRVLTNLRAQQAKEERLWKAWQGWTAACLATVTAAVLLIWAAKAGFTRMAALPEASLKQEVTNAEPAKPGSQGSNNLGPQIEVGKSEEDLGRRVMASAVRESRPLVRNAAAVGETTPRLAQFPAPEPLSEREKLLIQFVKQDPQDAALVAEATTERLQRATNEMKGANSSTE